MAALAMCRAGCSVLHLLIYSAGDPGRGSTLRLHLVETEAQRLITVGELECAHSSRRTPESMLLTLSGTGPQQALLACMILANFLDLLFWL